MAATARIKCNCAHEVQDKLYGPGARLANATQRGDGNTTEVRCTVCKTAQRVNNSQVKK